MQILAAGMTHAQAGVITVSIAVLALTSVYRCLPGRSSK